MAVKKPGSDNYGMVQDFRDVNKGISTPDLPGTAPYTLLNAIQHVHAYFSIPEFESNCSALRAMVRGKGVTEMAISA